MKTRYVAGFMFDPCMRRVALIRKNKPDWQRGLLNGIGGKIEYGEGAIWAMIREFKEEAGFQTFEREWNHFCTINGKNNDGSDFEVEFFFCKGSVDLLKSQEAERIEVWQARDIVAAGIEFAEAKTIGNLPWLVALAHDFGRGVYPPVKVTADYSRN